MAGTGDAAPDPVGAGDARISIGSVDRHRVASLLAIVTLAAASSLAVFGLPRYSIHGPLHAMGIMDPLCGGTRAVRLALRRDLAGSWTYNPAGLVVAGAAIVLVVRLAVGLISGRWLNLIWAPSWRQRQVLLVALMLALLVLEIRQQRLAGFLSGP